MDEKKAEAPVTLTRSHAEAVFYILLEALERFQTANRDRILQSDAVTIHEQLLHHIIEQQGVADSAEKPDSLFAKNPDVLRMARPGGVSDNRLFQILDSLASRLLVEGPIGNTLSPEQLGQVQRSLQRLINALDAGEVGKLSSEQMYMSDSDEANEFARIKETQSRRIGSAICDSKFLKAASFLLVAMLEWEVKQGGGVFMYKYDDPIKYMVQANKRAREKPAQQRV